MATDHDFLATGKRYKAAVCAGVDEKEAIRPSFNSRVLPGGLAVYYQQFTSKVPSNGEYGSLVIKQESLAAMPYA